MPEAYSTFPFAYQAPPAASFMVTSLGMHYPLRGEFRERAAASDDWLFVLFEEATEAVIDGQTVLLPAPCFLAWPPRRPRRYGHPGRQVRHHWLRCVGHEVPGWLVDGRLPVQRPIMLPTDHGCETWWQALRDEMERGEQADTRILVHLFCIVVQHIRRSRLPDDSAQAADALLRSKWHIQAHFRDDLDLTTLATMAGLSRSQYCARFQAAFGQSPKALCIRLRLQQACLLLQDSDLAVAEVARAVGYADPFHFSKLFRKHCGASPRRWRQIHRCSGASSRKAST
ncbi:MAG: helix-turn-helix domain-containing protein [Planctomycetota bacterium]